MAHHGQHLTRLQLNIPGGTLTQLPCPNLRELDLDDMRVQLGASSIDPGVLHSCTRLTKLCLEVCLHVNSRNSLATLSALVELQHLDLIDDTGDLMPSAVLQHLPHLTYLLIHDSGTHMLDSNSLVHVSCLTNLQELHIAGAGHGYEGVLLSLSPSTIRGLSRLTALRQVALQRVTFDPSILQDCPQLQGLELQWVSIISAVGAAALHSLLGRLQQQQSLQLHELVYDWPVAAAAYTSLTASSKLQRLHLTVTNVPAGIWPHVSPADRQLPALRELSTRQFTFGQAGPPPAAALGTDDLSCILRCCPGLCRISISVQPDTQLADLAKASSLISLGVSGLCEEGFASLSAPSALVSLQVLSVDLGGPISPRDLLGLTALTGLSQLLIYTGSLPNFEGAGDVKLSLFQNYPEEPPVWCQLLQHCGRFSECQPLIFQALQRQVLEQQQRHMQQEQQMAAQQQQITALQDQLHAALAGQQRSTSELQAQLAATRAHAAAELAAAGAAAAEAGELRGRLQALVGQVQQLLQAMLHSGR